MMPSPPCACAPARKPSMLSNVRRKSGTISSQIHNPVAITYGTPALWKGRINRL